MDFRFTEEQKMLQQSARSFLEAEIVPYVNEYERMNPITYEAAHEVVKKIAPLGYFDGPIPCELGGQGLDWVSYAILYEELAKAWSSLAGIVQIQLASALCLTAPGAEDHRCYLPGLLCVDQIWAQAGTEPDAGSNLAEIKTTADLKGDHYILNGTKTWISCALFADMLTVLAVTDKKLGPKGTSLIIIDRNESPFATSFLPKVGMRCWVNTELTFEDCRVPKKNIVGVPGEGLKRFLGELNLSRCCISTNALGAAQAALDIAIQYAKDRRQFGKPLAAFQLIQAIISDSVAELDAARFLVYRAWQSLDDRKEGTRNAALAKLFVPRIALNVVSRAMEVLGAYGISEEYNVERCFRDVRVSLVPDGTTQLNELIAGREILGISAIA